MLLGTAELAPSLRQVPAPRTPRLTLRLLRVVVVAEGSEVAHGVVVIVADVVHFQPCRLAAPDALPVEQVDPGAAIAVAAANLGREGTPVGGESRLAVRVVPCAHRATP